MYKSSLKLLILIPGLVNILSCNKKDTPAPADPCKGINYDIIFFKTESIGNLNNGTITINYPAGGDSLTYQLNSGSFQTSNYFSNLAPGNYVLTVKNLKGCSDTAQISILNYGPKFVQVKQLILGYCGPCHLNAGLNGNMNFDKDASIVNSWDRIKARAVDGNPSFMPQAPNSPLTNPDKQKIVDWVNAGHRLLD